MGMVWHFGGVTGDLHVGITDAILVVVLVIILYLLYAGGWV